MGRARKRAEFDAYYAKLGNMIREARKDKGMNQEDLAGALGVSRVAVTHIESGRQRLYAHHAAILAEVLGVDFRLPTGALAAAKTAALSACSKRVLEKRRRMEAKIDELKSRLSELPEPRP